MPYLLPGVLRKNIKFKRLNNKHVKGYEIYGIFQDPSYGSGVREELLDSFPNPDEPNTDLSSITLEYNENVTWELPSDLYTDRDHKFKIFINNVVLSTLYYQYNKYSRLLTIDSNLKVIEPTDIIRLDYYRDMISKTYMVQEDCSIRVKPIFAETYKYGNHSIII